MSRSRTNVDVAREMIECVNRADDDALAALMSLDVECFPDRNGPDPPFRGREAFLRYARGWTEASSTTRSSRASTSTSAST